MDKKKIHVLTLLVAFSLVASVLAVPAQAYEIEPVPWPDWGEATAYPDSTNDASPGEDMDVCYVTHDDEFLFFRIEFFSDSILTQTTDAYETEIVDTVEGAIFLDVDQNQMTGGSDFEGFSLHDIGAEWTISYILDLGISSKNINAYATALLEWNPVTSKWDYVDDPPSQPDSYAFNIAVPLEWLDNPEFPIDILFLSTLFSPTDYNPNESHVTYPLQPTPEPVGGEITPTTTLALTPWIALIGTAIAIGYTLTRKKTLIH